MSHCPPVDIANQLASDWNTAVDNGEFTLDFEARTIMGHTAPEMDSDWFSTPRVDIVPPMQPAMELVSRGDFKYGHQMEFMVGLRQAITNQYINPEDESFNLTAMAPLLDTFYELMAYLYPSGANPNGTRITVTPWVAMAVPPYARIQFLWNPELLAKKLYCGVFEMTLQVIEESAQS